MDPVIVVGAGISGITAARTLVKAGHDVIVLDRGKRIGGRMAVRTSHDRPVDIGASYFTVSDPAFEEVVDDWQRRGLARPWTDSFHLYDGADSAGSMTLKPGPVRWAAPRGLRSLVEDLAAGLDVRQQQVVGVEPGLRVDGQPAAAVALAMPDPQAARLLSPDFSAEASALTDPFAPVLVLTATWSERAWPSDLDGVFVAHDDALSWVADDGRRRGDQAPVLVAHSTGSLAEQHLSSPSDAEAPMVAALQRVLAIEQPPTSASVHRWSFAKPTGTREAQFFLGESGVGVCGDAWSDKPRVEAAFLSGRALGRAISERLP